MGLMDLSKEVRSDPQSFLGDEASELKVLKQVLALVEDKISEVKNQAVRWCVRYLIFESPQQLSDLVIAWVNSSRSFASHTWSLSSTN